MNFNIFIKDVSPKWYYQVLTTTVMKPFYSLNFNYLCECCWSSSIETKLSPDVVHMYVWWEILSWSFGDCYSIETFAKLTGKAKASLSDVKWNHLSVCMPLLV